MANMEESSPVFFLAEAQRTQSKYVYIEAVIPAPSMHP